MDNQSFNSLPLTQNQNDMSIQMIGTQHHQMAPQIYAMQPSHSQIPQMIQQSPHNQHHHMSQQSLQQFPQMSNPQMMNNNQMMTNNNHQFMGNNHSQHQQQYLGQQKQLYIYPSNPQQYNNQPTSRYSQALYCSNCQRIVPSLVEFKAGKGAWVSGLLIGLLGCWGGCCLIPCCNEDFQDAVHSCTICAQKLGQKQFLFN